MMALQRIDPAAGTCETLLMRLIPTARTMLLIAACALVLSACATNPIFRAGGYGGSSRGAGGAGVGIPF